MLYDKIGHCILLVGAGYVRLSYPRLVVVGVCVCRVSFSFFLKLACWIGFNYPDAYCDFVWGFHGEVIAYGQHCQRILQVLTRSLKTTDGLMRGRGMTNQQRLIWLLSIPACAETNRVFQVFTGVQYNWGEQNKDMTRARQKRDVKDTLVILSNLANRNRFAPDPNLRNTMIVVNWGLTMLSMFVALELLERTYCLQWLERQLVITLLRGAIYVDAFFANVLAFFLNYLHEISFNPKMLS